MPPVDESGVLSADLEAVVDAVMAVRAVDALFMILREDQTVAGNSIMLQLLAPGWPCAHPTFRLHITYSVSLACSRFLE
ncbi:hypothetical protein CQZ76_01365 [Anaplasma marginale]|nr:hypothetical protein CQZ76_01365 [Anaplasma marginale]